MSSPQSKWPTPTVLNPPLSDREAVADAAHRALLGVDTNDAALFESALTEDASLIISGKTTQGRAAIVSDIFGKISRLDTTHHLSNVRIDIDKSGARAVMTGHVLAQHYRGGQGTDPTAARYLAGGLYFLDVVKDEAGGTWRVKEWEIRITWNEGEVAIMREG